MVWLALLVGACEKHGDFPYTDNADPSWRGPSEDTRYYFQLLAALGYVQSRSSS